jgi:hypothetical protein
LADPFAERADLITRVLEELKVCPVGQPPAAIEVEAVDVRLDGILGELAARNIVAVNADGEIPVTLMEALAQAVGRRTANLFSIPEAEVDTMFKPEEHPFSPENRLRAINRSRPLFTPAVPDYF